MAEDPKVIIFPRYRISELKRDHEMKREAFFASREKLFTITKQKSNPLTFMKEHPGLAAGTAALGLGGLKIFAKSSGKIFGRNGIAWKILKMTGRGMALRFASRFFVQAATRSKRSELLLDRLFRILGL